MEQNKRYFLITYAQERKEELDNGNYVPYKKWFENPLESITIDTTPAEWYYNKLVDENNVFYLNIIYSEEITKELYDKYEKYKNRWDEDAE